MTVLFVVTTTFGHSLYIRATISVLFFLSYPSTTISSRFLQIYKSRKKIARDEISLSRYYELTSRSEFSTIEKKHENSDLSIKIERFEFYIRIIRNSFLYRDAFDI